MKQLEFNSKEQEVIQESLNNIATILLHKLDKGVEAPTITGDIDIENENRKVKFEITALKTKY